MLPTANCIRGNSWKKTTLDNAPLTLSVDGRTRKLCTLGLCHIWRHGHAATVFYLFIFFFYKLLASLLTLERDQLYSHVIGWIRCRLGFSLLWSACGLILSLAQAGSVGSNHTNKCELILTLATEHGVVWPYGTWLSIRDLQEQVSEHKLTLVQCGSNHKLAWVLSYVAQAGSVGLNQPNLLKQLISWRNKHHTIMTREYSVLNLLEQQSTIKESIRPQTRMSSLWFNPTELMRACGLILALVVLCSSSRFGVVRPYRTCLSNRPQQEQVSGHKLAWVWCG